MLKIGSVRWRGKCPRHPRFDPYVDGSGDVKGNCEKCSALVDIYTHHAQMLTLMRSFAPAQRARRRAETTADLQASLFSDA